MSDDLHDTEAASAPSTRDLVLLLLQRMGRIESALGIGEADTPLLSGRVNRLLLELADFKHEMRKALDDIDRSLATIQGDDARRSSRLDERISALEPPDAEP